MNATTDTNTNPLKAAAESLVALQPAVSTVNRRREAEVAAAKRKAVTEAELVAALKLGGTQLQRQPQKRL